MSNWAKEIPQCGTHMCACGWAASDRVLRKQGLTLVLSAVMTHYEGVPVHKIAFGGLWEFDAAAAFFDIEPEVAERLFDPYSYDSSPRAMRPVINRIKAVIKEAEAA